MRVGLLEPLVTRLDDRVKKVGECFVRLFISSNETYRHDEGVPRVINTRLNGSVECEALGCCKGSQLFVHLLCKVFGHVVTVLGEVWVVVKRIKLRSVQERRSMLKFLPAIARHCA